MSQILYYAHDRSSPKLETSLLNETQIVTSELELNQLLNDSTKMFLGCILKFPIISLELVKGTKLLRMKKPLLPTFVWTEGNISDDVELRASLARLTYTGSVSAETTLEEILGHIQSGKTKFKNIDADSGNLDTLNKESAKTDEQFYPVFLKDLILGKVSFFDVYIRLAPNRFIKLMNKGEPVDVEQLQRYREKGVEHTYLLKEQQSKFVEFCDFLSESAIKNNTVKEGVKLNQVLQFGDQILRNFELHGVNQDNIRFAGEFLGRGIELVRELGTKGKDRVETIIHALNAYEHTTAMALLGGMVTRGLGYTSPDKINTISMAILLHDVGMLKLPEHLRKIHDPKALSAEDYATYCQHPRLGYEMLGEVPEINDTVRQAVLHHHERRDRSGYPEKISGNSINFVAEIIGLCDEYLVWLEGNPKGHDVFMMKLDEDLKLKFSPQLLKAFKEVFKAPPKRLSGS